MSHFPYGILGKDLYFLLKRPEIKEAIYQLMDGDAETVTATYTEIDKYGQPQVKTVTLSKVP